MQIKVKAMCLLIKDGHILVADGTSLKSDVRDIVPGKFYRVIGGSVDFNEDAEDAVRREVREELNIEIDNLEKLDVIENRFVYAGEMGHEVVFLFKGTPSRGDWDTSKKIHIIEPDYEFNAIWVPIPELIEGSVPLYPATDYRKYLHQVA